MAITTANWTNSAGGDWGTNTNWSPVGIPGVNNNVVFGALSPYVVTIASGESQAANSVAINFAGATVAMTNSSLADTTTFFNSGVFDVDATGTGGSTLTVGSALNNSGTMQVGNAGLTAAKATTLTVGSLNNTLGASLSLVGGTQAVTVTDNGAMTNAGTLSVGSNSTIANAGTFAQTAGSTTVAAGGALTAKSFSVTAGSLTFNNSLNTTGQTYSVMGGAGASITFANLTNMVSGVLTGGTFTVGTNSTLTLPQAVTELDATLTLLGTGSVVTNGTTPIDTSLTTIGSAAGAAGTLNVTGGRSFASTSGPLTVNKGGLLSVDATSTVSGGAITDNGVVKDAGTISNTVTVASGGKLILVPGFTPGGTVTGSAGSTLELAAGKAGAVTLAVSGGAINGFGAVTVDSGAAWTVTTPTGELATTTFSALGGTDVLTFTNSSSALSLDGVIGFPTINLAAAGGNNVTVTANTLSKSAVTINDGGGSANTITSTNTTAGRNLTYVAGAQVGDVFTGKAENDTVKVGGANVGGDTFTGGTGGNTLTMLSASGAGPVSLANVSNFATINLFGAAATNNNFTLTNTTLTKTVSINDASSNTTIDASSVTTGTPGALVFNAGSGADVFTGGLENDFVRVSAAAIAADTLNGGTGANTLTLTTSGTNVDLTHVSNFATIALGGSSANTVIVGSATLNTLTATTINDTNSGTTLTATGSAGEKLTFNGVGTDNFTGGLENDSVRVTAAKVGVDTLIGGGGNDTLTLSTGGAVDLSHVSGFGTINLAAGASTVTVTNNTLSAGAVTLNGNFGSNSTITVTGAPANALTYNAGVGDKFTGVSEADTVNATAAGVSADTLNGGAGANTLNITTAGTFDITKDSNFGTLTLAAGTNVVTATTVEITGNTVTAATKVGVTNNNTLQFKAEGSADLTNVSGVNTVNMAATVANGSTLSGITVAALGAITINDAATGNNASVGNTVTVSNASAGTVTYVAATGHDTFNGGTGSGNDTVKISSANIATAHLTGSTGGNNMLVLTDAGFFSLPVANVSHFGTVNLAAGNSNVVVADTAFVGGALTINDSAGGGNNLVNASAITGVSDNTLTLNFSAGPGTDFFVGGVEIDKVTASAGALNHDVLLAGGNAGNTLNVSTAGGFTLGGVSNFHTINLASGNNAVTVTNTTLFGGAVTINDGAGGSNTITSLAAPGVGTLTYMAHAGATDTFNGGGENDTVFASGHTAMSGGLGTNAFVFTSSAAATNTITGFGATGATNELVFSNSAFALGFAGATSTPQVWTAPEASTHFSANTTGTYAGADSFNYNTTTGALDYSAAGSSASQTLVATLANHPGIATSQLFFVS